jgi:ABC-type uncharacterized transport system auxiliary subunit
MMSLRTLFLAVAGATLLTGCATSDPKTTYTPAASQSDRERVSTIPWNRPQGWEQGGAVGSMMGR